MGLDMYLRGRVSIHGNKEPEKGPRLCGMEFELGYWRKHPNLHGYIVQEFAGGEDNCQEIDISAESLDKLIAAVKANALPTTEGFFFFGQSDGTEKAEDLEILNKAKAWLEQGSPEIGLGLTPENPQFGMSIYRYVQYRASW